MTALAAEGWGNIKDKLVFQTDFRWQLLLAQPPVS